MFYLKSIIGKTLEFNNLSKEELEWRKYGSKRKTIIDLYFENTSISQSEAKARFAFVLHLLENQRRAFFFSPFSILTYTSPALLKGPRKHCIQNWGGPLMKSQRRKEERPQIRLKTQDMCITNSKSFLRKRPTDEHGWNIANRLWRNDTASSSGILG